MIPSLKKKEIIVNLQDSNIFDDNIFGIVVFKGNNATLYKEGDKVLLDKKWLRDFSIFGENLYRIEHEDYIICGIDESI